MTLTCGCDASANCGGKTVTAGVSKAAVPGTSACFDPPGTGIGGKSIIKNKHVIDAFVANDAKMQVTKHYSQNPYLYRLGWKEGM